MSDKKEKEYQKKYYNEHKEYFKEYQKKWSSEHKGYHKKYDKKWDSEHKEQIKEHDKEIRVRILNLISNGLPHCVRCGCDDIRFLEINHKNGGGTKEIQGGKLVNEFYWNIYKGRRKTTDLEILCRVCNSWHYLELKYGKTPHKVFYDKGIK